MIKIIFDINKSQKLSGIAICIVAGPRGIHEGGGGGGGWGTMNILQL